MFQIEASSKYATFIQQQQAIFQPLDTSTIVNSTLVRQVATFKQIGVAALDADKLEQVQFYTILMN